MKFNQAWNDFNNDVQRAISGVLDSEQRLDVEHVLAGLAGLDSPLGELLRELNREHELELEIPADLPNQPDQPDQPDYEVRMTSAVRETLNFFRIHHLTPIEPNELALRLLQMGSGNIDLKLEGAGELQTVLNQIKHLE